VVKMAVFSGSIFKRVALLLGVTSLLLFVWEAKGSAQQFGQNKVNYREFNWSYIQTEHFDIYFYTQNRSIVNRAARILEEAYQQLKRDFQYELRRRVPVIIYASHNDFEQTNVVLEPIGEATGGFTELFKNRVVVPFEGSWEKFRHVLHHELTHAVTFDMLYGGLFESLLGRRYTFRLPLWVAEGLAEYESLGWETEADMIIRDAVVSGYLPPIQQTGGYLVYKAGQSIFCNIAQHYGREKIGEFLSSLATTKNVDKSLRLSLGLGIEELNKRWHRDLRKQYWPEIGKRQEVEEFAKRLTNHKEEGSYLNASPAFSPYADKIAFLSDRSDYKDIYLMSAIDGTILKRLVRGEKSGKYEEMHWLRGGITWSPDATKIAFVAKSGDQDVLYVQTVKEKRTLKRYRFNLDGLFSPHWSRDGRKIVFTGLADGAANIYSVELSTGELSQLTDDPYDEADPCWSPDGTKIAFSSDRKPYPACSGSTTTWSDYDIYVLDLNRYKFTQITTSTFNDLSPTWSPDGTKLAFSSDRNGIYNIYLADITNIDSIAIVPITNALTGCFQPDWSPDGKKIAFSAFQQGGWDIFVLESPFPEHGTDLEPTPFRLRRQKLGAAEAGAVQADTTGQKAPPSPKTSVQKTYRAKFSPDIINVSIGYSSYWGLEGQGLVVVSDILGNHRMFFYGDLFYSLQNSNLQFVYYYLKRRTDYGAALFNFGNYYWTRQYGWFYDRLYGGALIISRPFTRFSRMDADLLSLTVRRNYYYWMPEAPAVMRCLLLEFSLVNDTAVWGETGPVNGSRSLISVQHSLDLGKESPSFTTFCFDYRQYLRMSKKYTFAFRLSGGASAGKDPQHFFVGGLDNWINARYSRRKVSTIEDFYFASFPTPLRGASYFQLSGTGYLLANFEFRYPFISHLSFGWPLPLTFRNIRGVLFTDAASAWNGWPKEFGSDMYLITWGFGVRINLGIAILRFDSAWKSESSKPLCCFSLGADF